MANNLQEKINTTFRALKYRNFKLFFSGQCISLVGTWIQQVAISWLIYTLTNSAFLMGVITFAGSVPSLFVSPFAGVIIDRINKYHALIFVQTLFMIQAFVFAILTMLGVIQVWHIIVLSVLMGITTSIDMPLRQSFVVQLVEGSEDLGNAISLNSSSFNLARLIGPAVAGVLIAAVGEGVCFLLNALSYIAVIGALFAMKIDSRPSKKKSEINIISELKEGFKYAYDSKALRNVILFIAASSLIGMSFPVVMPIFAQEVLHGGSQTLGFLMSASGIGALVVALYLAARKSVKGLENLICYAALMLGFGLIGLSFSKHLLLAFPLLLCIGGGMVTIIASCNTLIQHLVEDDKRGRIMSLYTMAFMGTVPFGSLLEGSIAEKLGVPYTFLLNGFACILLAIFFSTKLKHFKTIEPDVDVDAESIYIPLSK